MLSLTRGREIAIFAKGNKKGKRVFLHAEHDFSNKQISEVVIPQNKKFDLIPYKYFKDKKLKRTEIMELKRAVDNDLRISQVDENLQNIYEEIIKLIDSKLKNELDFSDISNVHLFPIPQKYSERIYIPAPSGSGKSTFIGEYLKQLRIKYPSRTIYVFSRVEYDEPIDRFKNVFRPKLSLEEFIEMI